ncbi:Hydrogenase maturation factor [Acetitomaculum ruminis DSM 5522]|uniref:Hydrogenase maturation factor n=1 Tax=Acetitomaculum ruminis DSM 5522 TaxID=1120918 RepID=A0A1I0XDH8_9FIRM|nr:AIR synthase family protein [Acetitomaculum ruminis]SFA99075.1 Hydrogenase maturation factor [Acetitomaculum ruminis DSM 5522]
MEIGKVPETVLKRSIIKQIKNQRSEVLLGSGVGEDCAALKLLEDEVFVVSTDPITASDKDMGKLAINITANDLASAGAEPVAVMLTFLLPPATLEEDIKELMTQIQLECQRLNIQTIGGHTEITDAVNKPVISVTGIGKVQESKLISTAGAKSGQDVVVTKWIGIEGTAILAREFEDELKKKYPEEFIDRAKELNRYLSVLKEAATAVKFGVSAMHDITEGGVFGALWEMSQASGVGLTVDLKKIPIRQETVEICEYFEINPYKLISSGSMLIAADNGHDLVSLLEKEGISASVIGKFTDSNDRVFLNNDERGFLEPPKTDEIYSVYKR